MPSLFSAALASLLACSAFAPDDQAGAEPSIRAGTTLLQQGDGLATKGEYTEAVIRYKKAFEQLLPKLRQLPFKYEVKRDVTKRENMKAMILKEIDEDMTPAEFHANEVAMKAFGLLPMDFNFKEMLAQVYSEEVAAFYDPKTKTMHLIEEPKVVKKKPAGLLEKLFGKSEEFDKDENKTVIAHEMTHALADQNYDLTQLDKSVKHDDDQAMALTALIEGEATLAMIGASMDDWTGAQVVQLPAQSLDLTFNLMMPFMPFMGGGKTLRQVPPIMSESMIFPYLKGLVFCAKLANDGGWKAVDAAYRDLPVSTEQILHPEKYRAQPDRPMTIELGKLEPGAEWKELGRNVIGEMQLAVMLRRHGGKSAAAGWDGDRYAVFEGPANQIGLVWATTWDTEADAKEFAKGYIPYQSHKVGKLGPAHDATAAEVWRNVGDRLYVVRRDGLDVVVVEGFGPDATVKLLGAASKAKKTELTSAKVHTAGLAAPLDKTHDGKATEAPR
jgi:hypothetical protein